MYKNKLKKKNKIFLIEVSFSNKSNLQKFSNTRRNCLIMSNVLVGRYSIYL